MSYHISVSYLPVLFLVTYSILYGTRDAFGMSIGLVVIDSLSFIFLIVVSCIACCGTCNNHQVSYSTTIQ